MVVGPLLLTFLGETSALAFAPKYDAAFAEAVARNVPVLILDPDGWDLDKSNPQFEAFYDDETFLKAVAHAVLVLASQEDHGSRKETVDGVEREVCALHGGTSCSAHRDMLPKVFADFGRDGQLVSPLFLVATPDHVEVARLEHEQRPDAVVALLKEAGKKLGPGLARADFLRLDRGVRELHKLVATDELASAVVASQELARIPGRFALHLELEALVKQLDDKGREKIAQAELAWSRGRHLDALLAMDDVKVSFGKRELASVAAGKVIAWEKSTEGKPHLPALKSDRAARALYLQAVESDRKGDARRAVQQLEKLIRTYPDSRFASRARSLTDELERRGG